MSSPDREYAMTAWGDGRSCHRPTAVIETAQRMRQWATTPEQCRGCHARPAVTLRAGDPICGVCREQREIRLGGSVERVGLSVRADADDDATTGVQLRGLAVVFNSRSEYLGFYEYIRPAAMDRTLSEQIDVRALWSHNRDLTIGRVSAGTLRMRKTSRGLSTEIDPPRWGASYVETVKRRDVSGMSFAFETLDDEWHMEDGEPTREVLDMRVFEVSGVSFPAYPATTLRVAQASDRSEWLREQHTAERLRLAR